MRILKPFMLLAVIGVLYSCAAVHLQTYRNGYIMDKNNVVVGYYWRFYDRMVVERQGEQIGQAAAAARLGVACAVDDPL